MNETSLPSISPVQQMSDLLSGMATALVDAPGKVRIESESAEGETILRLFVAEDDLGKVIGKQGRTARSLRTILGAVGSKYQQRFTLDVQSDSE